MSVTGEPVGGLRLGSSGQVLSCSTGRQRQEGLSIVSKRSFGRAGWLLALTCLVHGAAPTAARAQDTSGWADQVLTLVNQQRAAAGLNALTLNPELSAAAAKYSQYMANADFFAHDAPDGSTPQTRQEAAGY